MVEGSLVLEGGSLRCLFTAGVLDVFMEQGIELSNVIGVSAGSLSGINYVSKQIGRTAKVNIDYVNDPHYLGFRNLIKSQHSVFNFDFLFGEITDTLVPLDKEAFFQSKQKIEFVVTNCETGKEEYIGRDDMEDPLLAARASASMPLLSPRVVIENQHYLDGGIAMPIAYQRAIDEGHQKIVLVLTREDGYRKQEQSKAILHAYRRVYREYPELIKKLEQMSNHYNEMQEEISKLEKEGRVFIIRPDEPVLVSRMEKDVSKLQALYKSGRRIATERLQALQDYLEV